jgi:hypothetical protein
MVLLPLSPQRDDWDASQSCAYYEQWMCLMEATVLELLAVAKVTSKAKLDTSRVDTMFKVGDQVLLLTKELLEAADIGKLLQWWDCPFTVTACPAPNECMLALLWWRLCSHTVNVDHLKHFC